MGLTQQIQKNFGDLFLFCFIKSKAPKTIAYYLFLIILCLTEPILVHSKDTRSALSSEVPFGINHPGPIKERGIGIYFKDLGLKFTSIDIRRKGIEATRGKYKWARVDKKIKELVDKIGLDVLACIFVSTTWDTDGIYTKRRGGYLPRGAKSYQAYEEFLKALLQRYKAKIHHWMIQNEPRVEYKKYPEEYANLLKTSYKTIKEIDPSSVVYQGGAGIGEVVRGANFRPQVLEALRKATDAGECKDGCFDVFDIHVQTFHHEYREAELDGQKVDLVEHFSSLLRKYGFGHKPIISKGVSTYSGKDLKAYVKSDKSKGGKRYRPAIYQSEEDQAIYLFKRFVYLLSKGIKRIYWSTIKEKSADNLLEPVDSYIGLIYNGIPRPGDCDLRTQFPCPDPGDGTKKLSYYTLKLMVEKLRGTDFDNIKTILDGRRDNICLYKFIKQKKQTYVAWWDYFNEANFKEGDIKKFHIPIKNAKSVNIIAAVPHAISGADLQAKAYPHFFKAEARTVKDNQVSITFGKKPLYIELRN